tara:strand:+ start:677 stop:910 length:234 start_codon:yes stop_codon:yes gene_type:complete
MITNNEMKLTVLLSLERLVNSVEEKVYLLRAIDCDMSEPGGYDLNDQLMTFTNAIEELKAVINRSTAIVPSNTKAKV